MLLPLRSLWEEVYPLDEQFHFSGLLALGRPSTPDVIVVSDTAQSGGVVARTRKRRRHIGDFDSEPSWKTEAIQQSQLTIDDEVLLALLA